jgi:hypothetical protein
MGLLWDVRYHETVPCTLCDCDVPQAWQLARRLPWCRPRARVPEGRCQERAVASSQVPPPDRHAGPWCAPGSPRCSPPSPCLSAKAKLLKESHDTPWRRRRRGGLAPTHSWPRNEMGWMVSFTPRSRFSPGTHWTVGWVGLRTGLDTETRGKIILPLPRIEPWSPSSNPY